jgi:hypothetical protein
MALQIIWENIRCSYAPRAIKLYTDDDRNYKNDDVDYIILDHSTKSNLNKQFMRRNKQRKTPIYDGVFIR